MSVFVGLPLGKGERVGAGEEQEQLTLLQTHLVPGTALMLSLYGRILLILPVAHCTDE